MTMEAMNFGWTNFKCLACERPIRVQTGICEKVVCSCGWLQDLCELVPRVVEEEGAVT